ncbi:uncharacterized protein LOC134669399 [Cydia fagiglandana]|uniref:uncharacterized protein LOC134669399 n=1 Tax=Cydia fagiglandana TaxID=1458189 RepID=UPI002FEE11DD
MANQCRHQIGIPLEPDNSSSSTGRRPKMWDLDGLLTGQQWAGDRPLYCGTHPEREIEDMYNNLDALLDMVNDKDYLVIMGDFNAVVGEGIDGKEVGSFGLGKRNARGERLVQFCKENKLSLANTLFQQPKRRLYTWKMPGDINRYQLDYIIVKQKYRNRLVYCKTLPGADISSDHNLLISKHFIEKNKNIRKNKRKNIDLTKLKDPDIRVQYSNTLGDKLKLIKEEDIEYNNTNNLSTDIEYKWNSVTDIIKTSAEEYLGKENIVPRKDWITKDILDMMIERRQYKGKIDNDSVIKYKQLTNKITTKCREKKEEDVERKCDLIEHYMNRGHMDKAYKNIKEMNKNYKTKSTVILDEGGKMLLNDKDIINRWKRYIENLYSGQGLDIEDIELEITVDRDRMGPDILREEFNKALIGIQNGKAAGDDGLYIEYIKYAECDPIKEEIFMITQDIYKTGVIPKDFQVSKTITLPEHFKMRRTQDTKLNLTGVENITENYSK